MYWCELREGGSLLVYESKFAKRQPVANINVVKNGVIVYDTLVDCSARYNAVARLVRLLYTKLIL